MEVQVNFQIINPEYDQKYADTYHFGKESESNRKYKWGVSYKVLDVKSVSVIENEDFELKGRFDDSREFNLRIPNVTIYRCHFENGNHEDFAVSKTILNKTHQAKKERYDVTRFYFYINSEPPSVQLSSKVIVDEKDVPKALIKE